MQVLLLYIARFTLERCVPQLAIDEDITSHDAHRHPVGKHVEEGCLAGARCSLWSGSWLVGGTPGPENPKAGATRPHHQRGQRPWLDPTIHVSENRPRGALDRDIVTQISPMEDGSVPQVLRVTASRTGLSSLSLNFVSSPRLGGHLGCLFIPAGKMMGGRLVPAAEYEDLALWRIDGNVFGCQEVDDHKKDSESHENAEISTPKTSAGFKGCVCSQSQKGASPRRNP